MEWMKEKWWKCWRKKTTAAPPPGVHPTARPHQADGALNGKDSLSSSFFLVDCRVHCHYTGQFEKKTCWWGRPAPICLQPVDEFLLLSQFFRIWRRDGPHFSVELWQNIRRVLIRTPKCPMSWLETYNRDSHHLFLFFFSRYVKYRWHCRPPCDRNPEKAKSGKKKKENVRHEGEDAADGQQEAIVDWPAQGSFQIVSRWKCRTGRFVRPVVRAGRWLDGGLGDASAPAGRAPRPFGAFPPRQRFRGRQFRLRLPAKVRTTRSGG